MALRPGQLAKLRSLARMQHELELRNDSRQDALRASREYLSGMKSRLADLTNRRDLELRTEYRGDGALAVEAKYSAQIDALRADIAAAQEEHEQLQRELTELVQVSAPMRQLIDRVLQSQNMKRGDAGINFDSADDYRSPRPELVGRV